jgi:hypothetical protein
VALYYRFMLRIGWKAWRQRLSQPHLRWLGVLLYALYAVMPHDHWAKHVHTVGSAFHTHSLITLHEAELERQVLGVLGTVSVGVEERLGSVEAVSESEGVAAVEPRLGGAAGMHVPRPFAHSHYFSDANLLAFLFCIFCSWLCLGFVAKITWRMPGMPLRPRMVACARGPPQRVWLPAITSIQVPFPCKSACSMITAF